MKKLLLFFIVVTLVFASAIPASAANIDDTYIDGYNYLRSHGFDERIIEMMDDDEICKYSKATETSTETMYYAYVYDHALDETVVESYTANEYLHAYNRTNTRAENSKSYSWMELTIISTHMQGDQFEIMMTFDRKTNPFVRYTDVAALTFDTRVIPQKNTGEAKFTYTNSKGIELTANYTPNIVYSEYGVYTRLDIPGWGNKDMYGYLSVSAKVNSISGNTVLFNNWAYYAHKTNVLSATVNVTIPVGGGITITPTNSFNTVDVGLVTSYEP